MKQIRPGDMNTLAEQVKVANLLRSEICSLEDRIESIEQKLSKKTAKKGKSK